ncbi:hypothetical protein PoB_001987100 [Plakobranchus ocellatus]|uniref:Uncharacterized protein n=1 Tax=Plakobranchus ocellatus TaxID=259542 RepID=A0AAV3Z220_9GAST|nr:hypothetical protein PoB_001987100 [Plakobranchus ocellatus]
MKSHISNQCQPGVFQISQTMISIFKQADPSVYCHKESDQLFVRSAVSAKPSTRIAGKALKRFREHYYRFPQEPSPNSVCVSTFSSHSSLPLVEACSKAVVSKLILRYVRIFEWRVRDCYKLQGEECISSH